VTTDQIDWNRNNNQNINQNINRRDKCDTYGYRYGGECIVKKDKVKLDNPIINKNKFRKDKSTSLIISATFFDQH
jgi:hypothetical protein